MRTKESTTRNRVFYILELKGEVMRFAFSLVETEGESSQVKLVEDFLLSLHPLKQLVALHIIVGIQIVVPGNNE